MTAIEALGFRIGRSYHIFDPSEWEIERELKNALPSVDWVLWKKGERGKALTQFRRGFKKGNARKISAL